MEVPHDIQQDSLADLSRDTFVRQVRWHSEVDSTNTVALQLLADQRDPTMAQLDTPVLVYTERQTAGRGRGDHAWWTAPGSLTLTLIIDTEQLGLPPGQHPQLSLLTAVALARVVRSLLPTASVSVKWPNDVYLEQRKLAGILVETTADRPSMHVVGIGVNVNNTFAAAPIDVRGASVSLAEIAGRDLDRSAVLRALLQQIEVAIKQFAGDPHSLFRAWAPLCLLNDKTVTADVGGQLITGSCRGIDPTGALQVETDSGLRSILSGSIIDWH